MNDLSFIFLNGKVICSSFVGIHLYNISSNFQKNENIYTNKINVGQVYLKMSVGIKQNFIQDGQGAVAVITFEYKISRSKNFHFSDSMA